MKGKPIYKRWWFWVGIAVVIIVIAAASGGNNEGPGTADNRYGAEDKEERTVEKDEERAEDSAEGPAEAPAEKPDGQPSEEPAEEPTEQARQQEGKRPAETIEFSNIVVQSRYGTTMVVGEATNNDDKAHSFTIKVSFYDESGKLLGTAAGAMNDLNGGETKIFTAMGSEDYTNAAQYKVQVDTMVSSTANKKSPVEFKNITIKSSLGTTIVEGEAKNNDDVKHSFTIVIGFYDKDKKLLGTAAGAVNDLAPGETKIFTAMAAEDYSNADSYKIQVDTLVE